MRAIPQVSARDAGPHRSYLVPIDFVALLLACWPAVGARKKAAAPETPGPETAAFLTQTQFCAQYSAHGCFAALLASGKKRAAIKNATGFRGCQMRNGIAEIQATGRWLIRQNADALVQSGAAETPTRLTRPLFSRA